MKFILLVILFFAYIVSGENTEDATTICRECDNVSFCREDMIKCAFNVADVSPKDGRISPAELDTMKSDYMKWWEKLIAWIIRSAKTSNIMEKCDANKDGFIDRHDFDVTTDECIPLRNKKGELSDSLCKAKEVCDRATKNLGHKVY